MKNNYIVQVYFDKKFFTWFENKWKNKWDTWGGDSSYSKLSCAAKLWEDLIKKYPNLKYRIVKNGKVIVKN